MHDAMEQEIHTLAERDRLYQDLSHQLKSPLTALIERASVVVDSFQGGSLNESSLLRLRGLARQSLIMAQSIQFLTALNRNQPLSLNRERVNSKLLERTLIELAMDAEAQLLLTRGIRFVVDRTWLNSDGFRSIPVLLDWRMLRHCLANLLDNAGKYSFRGSIVKLSAGVTYEGLEIQVENTGLRLEPEEVELATLRDWRSPKAIRVTGEGMGIGLFIVDRLMKAHGGKLMITPTDINNKTVMQLVFPTSQ